MAVIRAQGQSVRGLRYGEACTRYLLGCEASTKLAFQSVLANVVFGLILWAGWIAGETVTLVSYIRDPSLLTRRIRLASGSPPRPLPRSRRSLSISVSSSQKPGVGKNLSELTIDLGWTKTQDPVERPDVTTLIEPLTRA
ncbi:hypothetical protein BJX70DRAFT_403017 [Aspergillus crustosus]